MGALIAAAGMMAMGTAVSAEPKPADPVDIDHEPLHKPRRSVHKTGAALHNRPQAQISDAHTDADRARIAAAIAKRERKAKRC